MFAVPVFDKVDHSYGHGAYLPAIPQHTMPFSFACILTTQHFLVGFSVVVVAWYPSKVVCSGLEGFKQGGPRNFEERES